MSANASEQLRLIAAKLKATGERELRLKLTRNIRAGAAPLIPAVKDAARQRLPKRGGLNEQVAGQRVSVSVLTGARTAGVRLRTTAPDTAQTDAGFVRHPLPNNNRSQWVTQQIPGAAGWWSGTLKVKSRTVTPAVLKVIAEISAEIEAI